MAIAALVPACAQAQTAVSTDPTTAPGGTYTLDPRHTSVTVKVFHEGLSFYTLRLNGVDGSYSFDPVHPENTRLQVSIDPGSVDTGDPAFNKQVADQVFEAAKFPQIRFTSRAVRPDPEGRGTVLGDLSFHGVTRPVTLDVIFNGTGQFAGQGGAGKEVRMGFSATTTIRRSDFGAGAYAPAVGDEVSVLIETEFKN